MGIESTTGGNVHNHKTLEQYWTDIANSNKEGNPDTIDKQEENFLRGSIYFVEEGMTKQDFMRKNYAIYLTQEPQSEFKTIDRELNMKPETLSSAVSRVVNEMLDRNEFETKKEVILGKISYLNEETRNRVLELLTPEERKSVEEHLNNLRTIGEQAP